MARLIRINRDESRTTENCDIGKLEKKHREFIAKEYSTVLTECDRLRAERDNAREALRVSEAHVRELSSQS